MARFRPVVAAGFVLTAAVGFPTAQADATTTGPTVIAVHRDGAVDVPGNSTFGTIAKMSVPAGNWSMLATATLIGTDVTNRVECQLVAGTEFYKSRSIPTAQGPGSSQSIVLLLAHHFAKAGTVTFKCYSDGWTGDVLIRDVHVSAVQVAQLADNGSVFGTGTPVAIYSQSGYQPFLDTAAHDLQSINLPSGRWLIRATAWAFGGNGNRIDCAIVVGGVTADTSFEDLENGERTISLEGAATVGVVSNVAFRCNVAKAGFIVYGSAISAIQVGTLKYGQLGGSSTTTGSGTPMVVGGEGGPGGITDATSLASIGGLSLGAGSWLVSAKLSLAAGAGTPKVTCQLKLSTASSQVRVVLDTTNNQYNWMALSLAKKLTATSNVAVACNQSAGSLGAFFYDLKVFALKAGTLTDTDLD